jgi:hypothetical protein
MGLIKSQHTGNRFLTIIGLLPHFVCFVYHHQEEYNPEKVACEKK